MQKDLSLDKPKLKAVELASMIVTVGLPEKSRRTTTKLDSTKVTGNILVQLSRVATTLGSTMRVVEIQDAVRRLAAQLVTTTATAHSLEDPIHGAGPQDTTMQVGDSLGQRNRVSRETSQQIDER